MGARYSQFVLMLSDNLGPGLVKLTEMAFEMARDARKSPKIGVAAPVKGFDKAGRSQI